MSAAKELHWQLSGGPRPLGEFDTFQDAFLNRGHGMDGLNIGPVGLTCIDEGIKPKKKDIVRMAGSGILLNSRHIDQIRINATPITEVYFHQECGAAAKYKEEQALNADVDEIAEIESTKIAKKLGIDTHNQPVKDFVLDRPERLHIARAVYYDGTRTGYETSKIPTLPIGFGISRGVFGKEIGKHDASLAINIALGPNGFEEKFTSVTPLHIVSIHDSRDYGSDPEQLQEEMIQIKDGRRNIEISSIDIAKKKSKKTIIDLK